MATIDVKDATGVTVALEKPLTPGRAAAASSRPVVLSTEDLAALRADGVIASATFTPIAAAYGAGDIMDVAKQFSFTYAASGLAVPAGCLIRILETVVKIDLIAIPSGQTSYGLACYSVTPPSAQADNAAWTLASGDLSSYRGTIPLGAPADLGACLYVNTLYQDKQIYLGSGLTSIFAELITDGAHTVASSPPVRTVILYGVVL